MGQFNTCNPIYCKKVIERTNPILDTLDMIYPTNVYCAQRMQVIMRHDDNGKE